MYAKSCSCVHMPIHFYSSPQIHWGILDLQMLRTTALESVVLQLERTWGMHGPEVPISCPGASVPSAWSLTEGGPGICMSKCPDDSDASPGSGISALGQWLSNIRLDQNFPMSLLTHRSLGPILSIPGSIALGGNLHLTSAQVALMLLILGPRPF